MGTWPWTSSVLFWPRTSWADPQLMLPWLQRLCSTSSSSTCSTSMAMERSQLGSCPPAWRRSMGKASQRKWKALSMRWMETEVAPSTFRSLWLCWVEKCTRQTLARKSGKASESMMQMAMAISLDRSFMISTTSWVSWTGVSFVFLSLKPRVFYDHCASECAKTQHFFLS